MSDTRRRSLERALACGDASAEAGLLVQRLRSGELPRHRLSLLALLEHPPARLALGADAPHPPQSLESWVRALAPAGQRAWVFAAVAAARLVLPFFERKGEDPRPREAVQAAEAWMHAPSERRAQLARGAAEAAYEATDEIQMLPLLVIGDEMPVDASVYLAEVFRETRAAVQTALAAGEAEDRALTHTVLAGVAARERLALEEYPRVPRQPSPIHDRAAQADRLGQLPELNTASSVSTVKEAMRVAVLNHLLEEAP